MLLYLQEWETLPTPQAARYSSAGEPNPPAPTTKIDDFKRFDCPTTKLKPPIRN